ncbi:MAG: tRNA (adenine57-N1/adenine58-N1)-methyltransferase [Candidatus Poriferisodalaceae bacterium]|jgi:tRNA (adenine57-N1/adenine58-N1)-methyltransferase catalytic subunit
MTEQSTPSQGNEPLRAGDRVMLIDSKQRRYLLHLKVDAEFHSHSGVVPHNDIIGDLEGSEFRTGSNAKYVVLRPTLTDQVLKMPRGAQVIYPKDLGAILMIADIHPGVHVLESGLGSGALSMALLRAGSRITGYEIREDFAERAALNVENFLGSEALERYDVQVRDIYEGIEGSGYDRIILDLPEPWQVVPHATTALRRGGMIVAYNPSIIQVQQFRAALEDGPFAMAETLEVLHRGWHVEGNAVRPDHRMVAHTGFLTSARLLGN